MSEASSVSSAAQQSREVAEHARESEWKRPSFLKELFLGRLRMDLVAPFPSEDPEAAESAAPLLRELRAFLAQYDADAVDEQGHIPQADLEKLRAMGAFGIKIPRRYGGLGLPLPSYLRAMEMVASRCGNLAALLSAHQSIGLPQPLLHAGTEEQKERWLPRLARGAISAFALTEKGAGSDPASLTTTAAPQADGSWLLNGEKIWCTNGTVAELVVVLARTPDLGKKKQITAFVIEKGTPGFEVTHKCRFMGLRALENAVLRFTDVRVPPENVLGRIGGGLKLALSTLNIGRLTVPAACTGASKSVFRAARQWAGKRVQWGAPVAEHEAIAKTLGRMAADLFAMESVSQLAGMLGASGRSDVRIEAAIAKLWNAQTGWRLADDALQIRGGRGYETATSLKARGEEGLGVERMLRDFRVNRIFEGSAEILRLFVAREALDHHLTTAFDVINPLAETRDRLEAFERSVKFYPRWYVETYVPRYEARIHGPLAQHEKFLEESVRRLGREIFHALLRYGPSLEKRQGILFRAVDIGADLFALAATLSRASSMGSRSAIELADAFACETKARVESAFERLFDPNDARLCAIAKSDLGWLDESALGLGSAS